MRYKSLLLEYSRGKTIDNYGPQIYIKTWLKNHFAHDPMRPDIEKAKELLATDPDVKKRVDDIFDAFESADPTRKKIFVRHFVNWYLDGSLRNAKEDAPKATETIELYLKFKNRVGTDLSKLSFGEFLDLGDELQGMFSRSDEAREVENAFFKSGAAKLVHNSDTMKIVIPETTEASNFFGRGTRWCTAATGAHNYFEEYNKQGPLYIIIFKGEDGKKWQFHPPSGSFMDARDEEIPAKDVLNCDELQHSFPWAAELERMRRSGDNTAFETVERMVGHTVEEQCAMIAADWKCLDRIDIINDKRIGLTLAKRHPQDWFKLPTEMLMDEELYAEAVEIAPRIVLHSPVAKDEDIASALEWNKVKPLEVSSMRHYERIGHKAMVAMGKRDGLDDLKRLQDWRHHDVPDAVLEEIADYDPHGVVYLFPNRTEVLWHAVGVNGSVIYEFEPETCDSKWVDAGRHHIVMHSIDTAAEWYRSTDGYSRAVADVLNVEQVAKELGVEMDTHMYQSGDVWN